jgi:SAM-dependent methyltransferase
MASRTKRPQKHVLYQLSVQNPEFETGFIRRVYKSERGKDPLKLREDFCGTGILACEWVRRIPNGEAIGLDLHVPTLKWGEKENVSRLDGKADRVSLVKCDVLETNEYQFASGGSAPDIVAAFNFSYFVFKSRNVLLSYFRRVYESLDKDGLFFLDLYGGPEAQVEQEESREVDEEGYEFDYVWDQAKYNPITGEALCHIHFDFEDGTRMRRAFTYDWRLWSLPEVKDLLADAGFRRADVYWEGTDHSDGSGNGVFRKSLRGDDSQAWICYIVGVK